MKTLVQKIKKAIHPRHPARILWHKSKALVAATTYGFPAKKLFVIGITGTDGKTTTVGMTAHILHHAKKVAGSLSTAQFSLKGKVTTNETQKTSPSPFTIQKFLKGLVDEGCTHAVVEFSSHGIDQGRTLFTWPKVAAITNLTAEHLDYHGTMEDYEQTKGKLFHMLEGKGTKVLSLKDRTFKAYVGIHSTHTVAYSIDPISEQELARLNKNVDRFLWLTDIDVTPASSVASLHAIIDGKTYVEPLMLSIPGAHNLENALCAIGASLGAGVDLHTCVEAMKDFHAVPGRLEKIDVGQPFHVFIDFTVTPASYEKTLSTLKAMLEPGKKLLVLTGSCGDRMKEKRPQVGRICGELADVVVVSNEDPYTEDPEKIIDEVFAGIDQSKTEAHRISDRREGIEFLFKTAKPGDIVVLCGKGNDTTMWVKNGQVPWEEREVARGILKNMT
jgi:UDP-N-acetylmuramoyl-L-alanyl-D-glutamate--2,6-diaminopimelate ligase